ncbi:hypothetical protein FJ987_09700 [Mesorhizobium sp. CU2]|uniref:hypothetical protein n=1 Tax=unclassified Mesorhizobium TaxID=325217 RepID=UPI001125CF42|nr:MULTISPECIES: hypothetical protein [unclassified Mesorhizobium]TPN86427.1 hypothetical protein FJ988_06465 [Mesorhizobium sp. CU3]TPO17206.1 hypothetical protein FJ987_09700 [Mesorhizobium sp. CU2]
MSNGTPSVGVPAHIYRKTSTTTEQLATDTDDEGKATLSEAACSADVQYRVEALSLIRYPRGRIRWESCRVTGPIVFLLSSSGVSSRTSTFLEGKIPDGWLVPQGYDVLFTDLRKSVDAKQWGAVAKLSSQLAAQYRSAGRKDEASTFAEIALAGTAGYAASHLPDENNVSDSLLQFGFGANDEVLLSPDAKKAVANLQTSCGLATDGVVGWKTMSCLPGGDGYTLPNVATVPFQSLVPEPKT